MATRTRKGKSSKHTVVVIGLGYVGFPLLCLSKEKGYNVVGLDRNRRKTRLITEGKPAFQDDELNRWGHDNPVPATTEYAVIRKADIIVICVPTPVDDQYQPDLTPVISAAQGILRNLRRGQLVIMESTVNPGVCEEVIIPILEKSGLIAGKDFDVAHCPERIDPGSTKWNVRNIPRVIGANSPRGLARAKKFYESVIDAPIRQMKSLKEAEATKIIENSFRDINIAFVNELAKSFEKLGIDLVDVIHGASTKPFAFLPHWPGIGVGGHCIPVDPYYLIERAKRSGFDHKFLKLAREINNSMPAYAVNQLIKSLNMLQKSVKGTRVGVLGLAYKANVADMRESPSVKLLKILKDFGALVEVYDPYFPENSTATSMSEILRGSEAIIVAVNHREFTSLSSQDLKRNAVKVVIDGKNCLDKDGIIRAGIIYKGIGR